MCTNIVLKSLKGRDHSRSKCRWEDNINIDLRKIGLEGVDWIDLAQDRDR
jgi:hypothetical protein